MEQQAQPLKEFHQETPWTVASWFGALFSIPLLTFLLNAGLGFIIYYFRLSYSWGLGGLFVPIAILFYSFFGNIVLISVLLLFLRKKGFRTFFLTAFSINLIFFLSVFGYYAWQNRGNFAKLKEQRHNDRWVDAKTISDCGTLTDFDYWDGCVVDKIKTQADFEACVAQVSKLAVPTGRRGREFCIIEYAAVIRNAELCNDVNTNSAVENQRNCVAEVVLHSPTETWGNITPRLIDGCLKLNDTVDRNFCLVASLRQIDKSHPLIQRICSGIDSKSLFSGNIDPTKDPTGELSRVKDYCGI